MGNVSVCELGSPALFKVQSIICLATAVIWVPFTFLIGYTSYEHWILKNYMHYTVNVLFFLGAICRTVWLFVAFFNFKSDFSSYIINRLAILFQFSAISFLLCMWTRSIPKQVSADKSNNNNNNNSNSNSNSSNNNIYNNNIESNESCNNVTTIQIEISSNNFMPELSKPVSTSIPLLKDMNWFLFMTLIANMAVWIFFAASLPISFEDVNWYQSTLLIIATLCFFEALAINIIGIRTGLKMYRELEPIFAHAGIPDNSSQKRRKSGISNFFDISKMAFSSAADRIKSTASTKFNYPKNDAHTTKLNIQLKAYRLLVTMSSVMAICFAVRCFCFAYNTLIACSIKDTKARIYLKFALYPLFYYQIPEFFPTIIAVNFLASKNSAIKNLSKTLCCIFSCNSCRSKKHPLSHADKNKLKHPSISEISGNDVNVSLSVMNAANLSRFYGMSNDGNERGDVADDGDEDGDKYRLSQGSEVSDYDANVDDVISYLNSEDGGGYEIGPATDNHNRTYSISSE